MPSTGDTAMSAACGGRTGSECTPKLWFEYLGDIQNNPYVPFQMNYPTEAQGGYVLLEPTTLTCNLAHPNRSACNCVDCEQSCPGPLDFPDDEKIFMLGEADGALVLTIVCGGVISIIILLLLIGHHMIPEGESMEMIIIAEDRYFLTQCLLFLQK